MKTKEIREVLDSSTLRISVCRVCSGLALHFHCYFILALSFLLSD